MRYSLVGLMVLACAGCGDIQEALESERDPVSPPGIAPVEEMGGVDVNDPNKDTAGNANGGRAGNSGRRNRPRDESIIGKTTNEVVDKQQAMADNPNLVVVEDKVKGSDPLTVAGSAYVVMSARVSTFGFQQALKVFKAQHGRNPTYEEFTQMMQENNVQFAKMRPYRKYGYDAETGGIVILEDKALKAEIFKERGIPLEE